MKVLEKKNENNKNFEKQLDILESEEVSNEQNDPDSFDNLLAKFKFGNYFIRASFVGGLGLFCEGTEVVLMSILNVIYKKDLDFSASFLSLLISCVFFGLLIGALVSGYVSDLLGRRKTMLIMLLCIFVPGILTAITTHPVSVFVCRTLAGFFMGIFTPSVMSYFAEITPLKQRGKNLVMTGAYWTFGGIFTSFVAFCLAKNVEDVDWRLLIVIVSQPIILSAVLVAYYLEESPRYLLLVKKDFEAFKESMRSIAKKNGSEILDEDLERTINWSIEKQKTYESESNARLSDLFSSQYKRTTITISLIWLVEVYLYYSIFFLIPSFQSDKEKRTTTSQLIINNSGEIVSTLIAFLTVENRNFGRKNSINLGWATSSFFLIIVSMKLLNGEFDNWLWALLALTRIMVSFSFTIVEVFTGEVYDSKARAIGVGFAHSICRISGILIAPLNQILLSFDNSAPFVFMSVVSFLGMLILGRIEKDTKGEPIH